VGGAHQGEDAGNGPASLNLMNMQFRHLRYFVKIVEAGSFSRASTTIHVAQPALSQQMVQLEEELGLNLLQRSARGVRPTAAGEVLFREASAILRKMEQLPNVVRSSGGEAEGVVGLGMTSTLLATLTGPLIDACKAAVPKVTLKLAIADSLMVKARVEANTLDLAVVFEDELVSNFARKPLFRQRLYLVSRKTTPERAGPVSIAELGERPLVLPSSTNITRTALDRAFIAAGVSPNVVAEADVISNILSTVRTGIGDAIIPKGDLSDISGGDLAQPVLVEPPVYLTCSIISSGDFALALAGEATKDALVTFIKDRVRQGGIPGAEWIG
jgi:LysR family transcriptional regulator, nitrogen assimilation regulatory protein